MYGLGTDVGNNVGEVFDGGVGLGFEDSFNATRTVGEITVDEDGVTTEIVRRDIRTSTTRTWCWT